MTERVPQWDWHAEEALPTDVPVGAETLDPRAVPLRHVGRVPPEPLAVLKSSPQVERADEPLARGDDLERPAPAS